MADGPSQELVFWMVACGTSPCRAADPSPAWPATKTPGWDPWSCATLGLEVAMAPALIPQGFLSKQCVVDQEVTPAFPSRVFSLFPVHEL